MPQGFRIIGTSRRERSDVELRAIGHQAIGDEVDSDAWERFATRLSSAAFRPDATGSLTEAVERAEAELGGQARRLLYLSVPPGAAGHGKPEEVADWPWPCSPTPTSPTR